MPVSPVLIAFITIGLWSFLAYFGSNLSHLPALFVVGIALTIGGFVSIGRYRLWKVPWRTFAVGVYGLFGYHFLYFLAFQNAPPVEVNLINYLWPLLIILLSPVFFTHSELRWYHLFGAFCGLFGAGLIITGGSLSLDVINLKGYLFACGAALVWSTYSLLIKRLPPFPTAAVGGFCFFSGLLSLSFHFLNPIARGASINLSGHDVILLLLLGIGPMGIAFFTWNIAMKTGDPRVIGSLAYLTPLTSTLVLTVVGGKSFTPVSGIAMGLIMLGAFLGSMDLLLREKAIA